MDDEGPLLEATVGGSEVMGSFWRAEREKSWKGRESQSLLFTEDEDYPFGEKRQACPQAAISSGK